MGSKPVGLRGWVASLVYKTSTAQSLRFFDELTRLSHAIQKDPIDTHRMICAWYNTVSVDIDTLERLRITAERGEALPWEAEQNGSA